VLAFHCAAKAFSANIARVNCRIAAPMIDFVKEFWAFLRVRKKFWLLPMMIILGLFGILVVTTGGSAIAPFIYVLF
jgi:hypothetical protein